MDWKTGKLVEEGQDQGDGKGGRGERGSRLIRIRERARKKMN